MKRFFLALSVAFFLSLSVASQAHASDGTQPIIGVPSPDHATAGVPVVVSVLAVDNDSGIASCNFWMDNNDEGAMEISNGTATKTFVFAQAGIHTVFVFCRDNSGSMQSGPNGSVTVTAGAGDSTPPTIGQITPTNVIVGLATTLYASVTDNVDIGSCSLVVNGFDQGPMSVTNGTATKQHIFQTSGTAAVYAQCFDTNGNTGSGPTAIVTISPPSPSGQTPPSAPPPTEPPTAPGTTPVSRLIKTTCPAQAQANHPCRAVYFQGTDGKRHAFPNEKIFLTWYSDFSTVQEITTDGMAAIPLGANVTYRPGAKPVKFTTVNRVYAVSKGSVLRWITSESVAQSLYGNDWGKKVDDIPDSFFTDYTFGSDITISQNYSPNIELGNTVSINDNH